MFIIILSFFSNLNVTAQTSEQIYKPPLSTVVTGSKYSEDSLQVPSFITTITKEQIQASGALTVDEAISRIGGIPSRPSLYGGNELNLDLGGFAELAASNQIIIIDGMQYKQGLSLIHN